MRAFTFIEVILVAIILVFILAGIFAVLTHGEKTWNIDIGLLDLQQEARSAMDGMVRELRQSKPSGLTITDLSADSTRIDFLVPREDSNTTYNVSYYLDGNNSIIREHPTGANCSLVWDSAYCKVLANNINYLRFALSGSILNISLKAEKSQAGRTLYFPLKDNPANASEVRLLKEKVRLRNE